MAHVGQWKVDVFLYEDDAGVAAEAVLQADAARPVVGRGAARLDAAAIVAEVGAELATSRALAALGHRLLEPTAADPAALPTSVPAYLTRSEGWSVPATTAEPVGERRRPEDVLRS